MNSNSLKSMNIQERRKVSQLIRKIRDDVVDLNITASFDTKESIWLNNRSLIMNWYKEVSLKCNSLYYSNINEFIHEDVINIRKSVTNSRLIIQPRKTRIKQEIEKILSDYDINYDLHQLETTNTNNNTTDNNNNTNNNNSSSSSSSNRSSSCSRSSGDRKK